MLKVWRCFTDSFQVTKKTSVTWMNVSNGLEEKKRQVTHTYGYWFLLRLYQVMNRGKWQQFSHYNDTSSIFYKKSIINQLPWCHSNDKYFHVRHASKTAMKIQWKIFRSLYRALSFISTNFSTYISVITCITALIPFSCFHYRSYHAAAAHRKAFMETISFYQQ